MSFLARISSPRLRIPRKEFVLGMWAKMSEDDLLALSAQMSFYFVLAMFPFFIVLAALVGTLPFTGLWDDVLAWIVLYLPKPSQHLVFQVIASLTDEHTSFLSIGLVGTLWASTGGTLALMSGLNVVYRVKETRSYLRRVGFSMLILCVLATLFLCVFGLLAAGDWISAWLILHAPSPHMVLWMWRAGRWVLSFLLTAVAVDIIDNTFPNHKLRWRWITPGALFTVVALVIATNGLNFYISYFGGYRRTYGVLAIFVILMVWIYISSLIILVGAEINWRLDGSFRPRHRLPGQGSPART